MAILLNKVMSGKRCWACGREVVENDVCLVTMGAKDIIYMHSKCAQSVSQELLKDISQLVDLGYGEI